MYRRFLRRWPGHDIRKRTEGVDACVRLLAFAMSPDQALPDNARGPLPKGRCGLGVDAIAH